MMNAPSINPREPATMRTLWILAALLTTLAACSRKEAEPVDDDAEHCCAFESEVTAAVRNTTGQGLAGVPVVLEAVDGGARWNQQTDGDGITQFGPGILARFRIAVTPPAGLAVVSPAAGDTTVTLTQDALGAMVTFVLDSVRSPH
jgi:hypothetical protein